MSRRLVTWDIYYQSLWPQEMLAVSVLDHGGGLQSMSTTFLMAVIYWGFTATRIPLQRDASAQFLRSLVDKAMVTRCCGFQLFLPKRGAAPVEVDRWGHFDLRAVVDPGSYNLIWSVLTLAASQRPQPQQPFDCIADRPHIVTFVVAALTPGNHISDKLFGTALTFYRQLSELINQAAYRMMQTANLPDSESCCRQHVEPVLEDSLADLTKLPSLKALAAALEGGQ